MRSRRASGLGLVIAVMAALSAGAAQAADPLATSGSDWASYLHGAGHGSANASDNSITAANVGHLRTDWHFTPDPATQAGQPKAGFDAAPTVVAGVVYIGSRTGIFYAINAATGVVIWKRQLGFGSNTVCSAKGIDGTATVQADPVDGTLTVYTPGAHYLYALKASDGSIRWKRAIGPATATGAATYYNWASPTVAGGRIFMGLAAYCESHLIRGGVVSLDQHTGAIQNTYYAVPAGSVGASVWSSEASDGSSVWVTTGNPDPSGTAVFDAYSIVRLTASSLAKVEKWTLTLGQTADLDFGSSPTLFQTTTGGVASAAVAACNKNGTLYAWGQTSLASGPIWQRQVSSSGANGTSCITSPAYDPSAHELIVAANNSTVGGVTVAGAVRALDPNTGAVIWEQGLPCAAMGSPSIDTLTGLVAVPTYACTPASAGSVRVFSETTGTPLATLAAGGTIAAQPVFADGQLFVAGEATGLSALAP